MMACTTVAPVAATKHAALGVASSGLDGASGWLCGAVVAMAAARISAGARKWHDISLSGSGSQEMQWGSLRRLGRSILAGAWPESAPQ
jgi:hypothetical protein